MKIKKEMLKKVELIKKNKEKKLKMKIMNKKEILKKMELIKQKK